jgi:hypothetical protein
MRPSAAGAFLDAGRIHIGISHGHHTLEMALTAYIHCGRHRALHDYGEFRLTDKMVIGKSCRCFESEGLTPQTNTERF